MTEDEDAQHTPESRTQTDHNGTWLVTHTCRCGGFSTGIGNQLEAAHAQALALFPAHPRTPEDIAEARVASEALAAQLGTPPAPRHEAKGLGLLVAAGGILGIAVVLTVVATAGWLVFKLLASLFPDTAAERYEDVIELRDAAIDAGYQCSSWYQTDTVPMSSSSGVCSDQDFFAVFDESDKDAIDDVIATQDEFGGRYLRGPNWVIVCPNPQALQSDLGGTTD